MSAWLNPAVIIFEGEDEAKLKAHFVELSARYPERNCFEIGQHVFRELRDPATRGSQAGKVWSEDLEILERVRKCRLNGGVEELELPSKEQTARELLALAQSEGVSHKERLTAYKQYCEVMGHVEKAGGKPEAAPRNLPIFRIAKYADA